MRIAVFGGSFDPPHLGHQLIVREVLNRQIVDEVWLLPVKSHAFAKNVTTADHRLAMLKIMMADLADARVKIETFELHQHDVNYTYQTLVALRAQHPQHTFFWLMGSDQLPAFHQWFAVAQLLREFPVLVYPRAGYGWEALAPQMTALTDFPEISVSSTNSRAALQQHQVTTELVLPQVAAYSTTHHLYDS